MGRCLGTLVSGGLLLVVAEHIAWKWSYIFIEITLGSSVISAWLAPETPLPMALYKSLRAAFSEPIKELYHRENILLILVFLVLLKCRDGFLGSLVPTSLLQELHFSLSQVGLGVKVFSMIATIIGIFY